MTTSWKFGGQDTMPFSVEHANIQNDKELWDKNLYRRALIVAISTWHMW